MKKLALIILLFFTTSCQTPEQLIREERIQQGMSKNAIWNAMVDVLYADDISMPNCFRAYYPDTKHEILSSSSRKIFYVFGNVTIPASVLDCDDQGNGYLEQIYRTYEESLASISSISESKNIPKDIHEMNDHIKNFEKIRPIWMVLIKKMFSSSLPCAPP